MALPCKVLVIVASCSRTSSWCSRGLACRTPVALLSCHSDSAMCVHTHREGKAEACWLGRSDALCWKVPCRAASCSWLCCCSTFTCLLRVLSSLMACLFSLA